MLFSIQFTPRAQRDFSAPDRASTYLAARVLMRYRIPMLHRVWYHTWAFSTGGFISGGVVSVLTMLLLYRFGIQTLKAATLSIICGVAMVVISMLGLFLFNCLRWRDLDDPPRHLKWRQRQHIAAALRSTEADIVLMSLCDGVKDAAAFADEIKAAFEDAGWTVDITDRHLRGELEHECGLWVYGHSLQVEEASIARELIAAAFQKARVPIHVDRRTNLTGGRSAEIVVGRLDKQRI